MLYLNAGLVSAFGLNLGPAYRTAPQTLADVKFPFTRRAGVKPLPQYCHYNYVTIPSV